MNIVALIDLWTTMLGTPPTDEQFTVWTALHTPEVVRQAILKTAAKDLSLGKTMTFDYKVRFASKVMLTQTERNAAHASNREKLREELENAATVPTPTGKAGHSAA
jgi:hypothetical protein